MSLIPLARRSRRVSGGKSRLALARAFRSSATALTGWSWLSLAIAGVLSVPIAVVLGHLFLGAGEVWQHLARTVLGRYVANSAVLGAGVAVGTGAIGIGTAWLVAACDFPGRRGFEWALLLPLAVPAYLMAYVYTELLEFYGPVQTGLRGVFGWEYGDYWFPEVRSLGGAIAMLALVLYPYVYLLCRVAFLEQAAVTLEASRSLGLGPWRSFWRVALPLARPAAMAGLALVLMETLSDFGTVQFFGVDTFTTGIYRTWFGLGDRAAAAQLAAVLLLAAFALVALERRSRGRAQYAIVRDRRPCAPHRLSGWRAAGAIAACAVPLGLGFLLPAGILVQLAASRWRSLRAGEFWEYARHSGILAIVAAALAVLLALVLAYGVRLQPDWALRLSARVASLGYAVPGSVVAVGVLMPLGAIDNAIDAGARQWLGVSTGLLLSGTIAAVTFAYLVRFLSVSFSTVEASLGKIEPSLDCAARSLGCNARQMLLRVHAPLAAGGLLTAGLLVFVDVMKELPATLIIRPFNFDTLAVRVYQLASDERLAEAAAPALAIVAVGLLPTLLLSWQIARSRSRRVSRGESRRIPPNYSGGNS